MKPIFNKAASVYDLLYADKDYTGEVEFILDLARSTKSDLNSVLELGCGTGGHAIHLARKGFSVTGIDRSHEMLTMAENNLKNFPEWKKNIHLHQGDVRSFVSDKQEEFILSLFHVISYQTSSTDIDSCFQSVSKALKKGGIFIFDFWYGPGVLSDRPSFRLRKFENDRLRVVRYTTPELKPELNVVDVNFHFLTIDKADSSITEFTETHSMRYFFYPELEYFLTKNNMKILRFLKWNSFDRPDDKTWYACILAIRE